ncbi:hypothetical protein RAAC3_TM7C00001G0822 [Candidatus Saccharibacteria bacterium RAAC3_TM7_1]|nr:hypothetical protein RAAC3_TM7C00001G0822 [Candidatus Saccharibacteria bacterium RAAC3_TM7_1]HCZ28478.1 TrmH family RNA methyltransferase [Candidatus Saccharibacteria bacterium]
MPEEDTRNVTDEFKGWPLEAIVDELDKRGIELEVAIENTLRDFNMGTIVRSANAFGVRHVHVIGRRQWNKRGAMVTDKYLHLHYYVSVDQFVNAMHARQKEMYIVDNIKGSRPLAETRLPRHLVMVFGQEGPGVSSELAAQADNVVAIEQFGSTRSINVGVAAGIAMYAWAQQHTLKK